MFNIKEVSVPDYKNNLILKDSIGIVVGKNGSGKSTIISGIASESKFRNISMRLEITDKKILKKWKSKTGNNTLDITKDRSYVQSEELITEYNKELEKQKNKMFKSLLKGIDKIIEASNSLIKDMTTNIDKIKDIEKLMQKLDIRMKRRTFSIHWLKELKKTISEYKINEINGHDSSNITLSNLPPYKDYDRLFSTINIETITEGLVDNHYIKLNTQMLKKDVIIYNEYVQKVNDEVTNLWNKYCSAHYCRLVDIKEENKTLSTYLLDDNNWLVKMYDELCSMSRSIKCVYITPSNNRQGYTAYSSKKTERYKIINDDDSLNQSDGHDWANKVYHYLHTAQENQIILIDEPGTYLSIDLKILIKDEIKNAKAKGATVIYTTHDPVMMIPGAGINIATKNKAKYTITPQSGFNDGALIEAIGNDQIGMFALRNHCKHILVEGPADLEVYKKIITQLEYNPLNFNFLVCNGYAMHTIHDSITTITPNFIAIIDGDMMGKTFKLTSHGNKSRQYTENFKNVVTNSNSYVKLKFDSVEKLLSPADFKKVKKKGKKKVDHQKVLNVNKFDEITINNFLKHKKLINFIK